MPDTMTDELKGYEAADPHDPPRLWTRAQIAALVAEAVARTVTAALVRAERSERVR